MKHQTYLGTFIVYDGEHEHTAHSLVKARSMNEADRLLEAQTHEVDSPETQGVFNYGDGTTRSKLGSIRGLTEVETKVVTNLGLAYYMSGVSR